MKNPNGFGSVIKISGKLRKPYCARITIGYTDKGYPRYKKIGYFATKKEAFLCLSQNYEKADICDKTFEECAIATIDELAISKNQKRLYELFLIKTTSINSVPIKELKFDNYQRALKEMNIKPTSQRVFKTFIGHVEKYAKRNDIIDKMYYSHLMTDTHTNKTQKDRLAIDEIQKIFQAKNLKESYQQIADIIFILLYSGVRINELLKLEIKNINLDMQYFITGSKTNAGINRTIPIHSKILAIINKYYNKNNIYLFQDCNYKTLMTRLPKFYKSIKVNYHPFHEFRHTFRSRMADLNADKTCVDLIMGHKTRDVGLDVYTHKSLKQLKEVIDLLYYPSQI